MAAQHKAGQQAQWLTGEEVRKWEPGLSEDILGALYIAHDGHVLAPELSKPF